jgi:hypothetical protein
MQVQVMTLAPREKQGLRRERPEEQAPARVIDSSVSGTPLRATRYAGSGLSNAKQGALRSAVARRRAVCMLRISLIRSPQDSDPRCRETL